jgi:hypothetical protein
MSTPADRTEASADAWRNAASAFHCGMSRLTSTSPPVAGYPRVKAVRSFAELVATPFRDGVNALCWTRQLRGDFAEVVRALGPGEGIVTVDDATLLRLGRWWYRARS